MQPEILLTGMMMGLAFAAPPGVVTAETFRRGLGGGFAGAFGVQLGSLIGDGTYALLALAGLAAIAQQPALQLALGGAGTLFLLYLALASFRAAPLASAGSTTTPAAAVVAAPGSARSQVRAFLSGLTLSLTNPWAILFWLSLGGSLASLGLANASRGQVASFFAAFMLGSALWAVFVSLAIARVRRWFRPVFVRAVSIACGLALGAFGVLAATRMIALAMGI